MSAAGALREGPPNGENGPAADAPLVAVTGAGGFIGRALGKRLAGRVRMRGLFQHPDERTEAWRGRGGQVVVGDLEDEGALAALLEGADVVHHLAARKAKDDLAASRRVNVLGTERLALAAREAGVRRLVYTSSISVYAATEGPDVERSDVPKAAPPGRSGRVPAITEAVEPLNVELLNAYSRTKYEGELALRDLAGRDEGPASVIVRPTNVYGPGGSAWFGDWVARLRRVPLAIGRGLPIDLVHVDDVARALDRAAATPEAAGALLHLGGESVELADYLVRVGAAVGLRVRRLPHALDRLARHVIDRAHRHLKGGIPATSLTRRVVYPHDRARRLLGWEPEIPLDEGLEVLGRAYRS